ncbi:MAG: hypothetical protein ACI902_001591 [Psychroserpens sp.]|jgi:hypothetical protein
MHLIDVFYTSRLFNIFFWVYNDVFAGDVRFAVNLLYK